MVLPWYFLEKKLYLSWNTNNIIQQTFVEIKLYINVQFRSVNMLITPL